jgi:UDP-N-acetylmuramate dehydrogenase
MLISDNGFDGLVIRMTGGEIQVEGERMVVDAGVMMARAVMESGKAALHGFEWGIGVPGTIGGSIRGNAGCFGGEMKDVVESVNVFDMQAQAVRCFSRQDCGFGYRNSIFKTHPEWIVVSAVLCLQSGDHQMIQKEIGRIAQERITKQDIGTKSCGCIFKNISWPSDKSGAEKLRTQFPELTIFREYATIPSAFLIDRCGLKGRCEGSICISDKHANFFINGGGGKSEEVMALIAITKEEVKKKYGIDLEEEIHRIGF